LNIAPPQKYLPLESSSSSEDKKDPDVSASCDLGDVVMDGSLCGDAPLGLEAGSKVVLLHGIRLGSGV